ncbi:MAG: hypothetical protein ACOC44_20450 [Promethearchaeia archaeon]
MNKNLEFELAKDLIFQIEKHEKENKYSPNDKDIVREKENKYKNYISRDGIKANRKLCEYIHKRITNYLGCQKENMN